LKSSAIAASQDNGMGLYFDTARVSFSGLSGAFAQSVLPAAWASALWARHQNYDSNDGEAATRNTNRNTCLWITKNDADGEVELTSRFYLHTAAASYSDDTQPCAGTDWLILFWLFGIVHTISWSTRWLLFEPYYRYHYRRTTAQHHQVSIKDDSKDMQNFSQSCTACLFHTLSAYFAYRVLSTRAWLYQQDQWFRVDDDSSAAVGADLKFYYLLYAARYLSDAVSLLFEHPRSDTPAYAVHHFVTIGLVLLSAHAHYTKAGGVLMYILDWADPFLLAAKASKYLSSHPADVFQFASDRLFEMFAVVFVATRNIMFTYVVYIAVVSQDDDNADKEDATIRLLLKGMLVILAFLMVYWLGLILQAAAYQRFHRGNVDDIREDEVIQRIAIEKQKTA